MSIAISPAQFSTLQNTFSVLSWLSCGLSLLLVFLNLLVEARRKFPARMISYFALCACLFSANNGIGAIVDYQQVSPFVSDPNMKLLCRIQGFVFQYFALCMCWWYILIYYTLYQVACHVRSFDTIRDWESRFLLLALIMPLPFALAPTLADTLGAEAGLLWCWMSEAGSTWKFLCLYGHMAIIITVGISWLCRTLKALISFRAISCDETSHSLYGNPVVLMNDYIYRHVVFVCVLFVIFVQATAWGINYALWEDALSELPYWFCMTEIVCVGGIGIMTFLVFAITDQNLRLVKQCCSKGLAKFCGLKPRRFLPTENTTLLAPGATQVKDQEAIELDSGRDNRSH